MPAYILASAAHALPLPPPVRTALLVPDRRPLCRSHGRLLCLARARCEHALWHPRAPAPRRSRTLVCIHTQRRPVRRPSLPPRAPHRAASPSRPLQATQPCAAAGAPAPDAGRRLAVPLTRIRVHAARAPVRATRVIAPRNAGSARSWRGRSPDEVLRDAQADSRPRSLREYLAHRGRRPEGQCRGDLIWW
jgi:hypothetical protein